MGSLMTLSHLTLVDLEKSKSRSLRFRNLIPGKGAEFMPYFTIKHQLESTYGESNACKLYI